MTTLAYRAPYLMGDGGSFHDVQPMHMGTVKKITKVPLFNGLFMYTAICGDGGTDSVVIPFLSDAWRTQDLRKSLSTVLPEKATYGVLAVMPNKEVWFMSDDNNGLIDVWEADYHADGSGFELAMGAMAAGADAVGALQATALHNIYTKYPFQGYNVITGEELTFKDDREINRWRNKSAT